ncbi:efflux RND transporter permease subunit [Anaerosalibacter sp. Marseille-P3206]|uniref:efflux RND transporter permease subunit n=1 Tax=Anaerosalibacter sp. Marseille-P3206 TaxID=1871005 RepID=UPI000986B24E|nr:MMPL family transporter [Anaerosalibacter sp. Marseille-P3206]
MNKFGYFVAKNRVLVLIVAALLILPSLYGMAKTRINYDILTYLPEKLDSVKGQQILSDVYKNSGTSFLIIENMQDKDVAKLKDKIAAVEGVEKIVWINDFVDFGIPKEILPNELKDAFYREDSTLMMIHFSNEISSDITQDAVVSIRSLLNKQCFLAGTASAMRDTIDIADRQTPVYVLMAIVFAILVLILTLESTIIPFIILFSMGFAILYNFGTNVFFGEISYVTESLAAVLQLGVTMDYSIFLLHRFNEESEKNDDKNQAMANAIQKTAASIFGSSLTTVAGFLAICAMELTIGRDIGIVMAKGVLLGLLSVITILPALMLVFDKLIHRFSHKTVLPEFNGLANLVTKHYKAFIVIGILLFIPAFYGQSHNEVYYNIDESLPDDIDSVIAFRKLKNDYNMMTTHMILVSDSTPNHEMKEMVDKIEKLDGIERVISYEKFLGPAIPENFIPQEIKDQFQKGGYKLVLINSRFKAATDEENAQIDALEKIVKGYDEKALITGEGVLTKDLIKITDTDFKKVNLISILAIFVIVGIVFTSFSIPLLLIAVIQLAIFINMSIPFYAGNSIPFISTIIIGSIQLGATVDYAILLTTRFREEIRNGHDKFEAMHISVKESARSIVTSGFTFFGATIGVAAISKIQIISSISAMIARGALISTGVILFILPGILIACEGFIKATSRHWNTSIVDKIKEGRVIYENK